MAKRPKTIITCAITGAIHTPTMSDALPYTAQDIAAQAIAAAEGPPTAACRSTRKILPPSCRRLNKRQGLW